MSTYPWESDPDAWKTQADGSDFTPPETPVCAQVSQWRECAERLKALGVTPDLQDRLYYRYLVALGPHGATCRCFAE